MHRIETMRSLTTWSGIAIQFLMDNDPSERTGPRGAAKRRTGAAPKLGNLPVTRARGPARKTALPSKAAIAGRELPFLSKRPLGVPR